MLIYTADLTASSEIDRWLNILKCTTHVIHVTRIRITTTLLGQRARDRNAGKTVRTTLSYANVNRKNVIDRVRQKKRKTCNDVWCNRRLKTYNRISQRFANVTVPFSRGCVDGFNDRRSRRQVRARPTLGGRSRVFRGRVNACAEVLSTVTRVNSSANRTLLLRPDI